MKKNKVYRIVNCSLKNWVTVFTVLSKRTRTKIFANVSVAVFRVVTREP